MNGLKIIEDTEYEYMEELFYHEGFFLVAKNDKYGIIDKSRKIVIPLIYDDYLTESKSKFLTACKNDKYGLIDLDNNVIIPFEYDVIRDYLPESLIVKKNGKYGFISINNEPLTEFKYDDLLTFDGFENYVAKLGDKYGIVDKNLNIITDFIYEKWILSGNTLTLAGNLLEIMLKSSAELSKNR